jgi:hypothetical protein
MADPPRTDPPTGRRAEPAAGAASGRPARQRRRMAFETVFQRLVATIGVIGVGVAVAAILDSQNVAGWIIGLVVSIESVVLTGLLWSPRET